MPAAKEALESFLLLRTHQAALWSCLAVTFGQGLGRVPRGWKNHKQQAARAPGISLCEHVMDLKWCITPSALSFTDSPTLLLSLLTLRGVGRGDCSNYLNSEQLKGFFSAASLTWLALLSPAGHSCQQGWATEGGLARGVCLNKASFQPALQCKCLREHLRLLHRIRRDEDT